ncbi:LOW QUALITY PROTEIN: E3 UFM1-protein ligase 1 homolog [Bacillus rossius redtenbacheri]|uniref:LOW QUALITY PROTEIN: E3 UFM1-protein ligase 1 homolog n=1 Tax=Bacillus rossius redtenbacheri TaxID=93214 RepID=UPI002FDD5453
MTTSEWDEVKRLAADFQRAQLSTTVQRLSERNCVEIITKLIELQLLDVIFTNDGKEYLTPQQLVKEIRDELYVHGGRINLVELSKALNVDLSQVTARAAEIERSDAGVSLVLGQLVDRSYLGRLAREVDERLAQHGQVTVGDLARQYDLPGDFLQSVVEKQLGKTIRGRQDRSDPRVFFTESFVARNTACVRGSLAACTRPTPIASLLGHLDVPERMFFGIVDSLMQKKQIAGTVTGRQIGSSIYVPTAYSKSQSDWVNSFYRQNGYLEYDALARLGISEPRSFVSRHFPAEKLLLLSSCAVGRQLFEQVEASVDEAVATGSWIDVMPILPSVFGPEDAEEILASVLKGRPASGAPVHVFCSTVVVTEAFLGGLVKSLEPLVQAKAQEAVSSGAYLQSQAESRLQGRGAAEAEESGGRPDRREERRKKATGGKGGGGTQGRETKTKSTKKKYQRGKAAADDSDDDEIVSKTKGPKSSASKLEFVAVGDMEEILSQEESFKNEDMDELIQEIAVFLHPKVNRSAGTAAQALFESAMSQQAHSRRKTHGELQDKLNALVTNVRLFERGLRQFDAKDTQQQLARYLLKTVGAEVAGEIFAYVAAEHMVQFDHDKEVTAEVRVKIMNEVPNNVSDPLMKLHKSLSGSSVDEFVTCVEAALGPGVCDMVLRKLDKKKERPLLHAHKQALLEQLSAARDPALVLHLAALVLFQTLTQTMLHASGRFVSPILALLQSHLPADVFATLRDYHDMVMKLLSAGAGDEGHADIQAGLEARMGNVKELATVFKRNSVSEKS